MRPVILSPIVFLFCFACGGLIKESLNQDPERQALVIESTPVYDGMIAAASNTTFAMLKPFSKVYVNHDSLSINNKKFVGVTWHEDSSGYVPVGSLLLKGKVGVIVGARKGTNSLPLFKDRELTQAGNDSFSDWQLVAGRPENLIAEVMFVKGSSTVNGYVGAGNISFDSLDLAIFYASQEAERKNNAGDDDALIELFRNENFRNRLGFQNHFGNDDFYQEVMTGLGREQRHAEEMAEDEAANGDVGEEENKEQYTSFTEFEWTDDAGNVTGEIPGSIGIYVITKDGKVSPSIPDGSYIFNGEMNVGTGQYIVEQIKIVFVPEVSRTNFTLDVVATDQYSDEVYSFSHEFINTTCCETVYTFTFGDHNKFACSRIAFKFKGEGVNASLGTTVDCGE